MDYKALQNGSDIRGIGSEGVEGQQRPEPLAAFAGDQGLTRDLAGYGQARAFDGVVGVERHETVHRVGDAGLDQGQIR